MKKKRTPRIQKLMHGCAILWEGVNGAAYREHPEWAQINPGGGTTATETLGIARRPYLIAGCVLRSGLATLTGGFCR